jgi:glucose-6-phosphate-specific signal transduction histidine kinase
LIEPLAGIDHWALQPPSMARVAPWKKAASWLARQRTDDRLHLEVADDGSGGVRAGGGMRGMADRVHALGGELAVHSTTDGTRVRAVIPCAS